MRRGDGEPGGSRLARGRGGHRNDVDLCDLTRPGHELLVDVCRGEETEASSGCDADVHERRAYETPGSVTGLDQCDSVLWFLASRRRTHGGTMARALASAALALALALGIAARGDDDDGGGGGGDGGGGDRSAASRDQDDPLREQDWPNFERRVKELRRPRGPTPTPTRTRPSSSSRPRRPSLKAPR